MKKVVVKLNNTILHPNLIFLYFNTYLLKSIFFRCEIINLNEKQEKELQKMYEEMITTKLGLGQKFLRHILYNLSFIVDSSFLYLIQNLNLLHGNVLAIKGFLL